MPKISVIMPAYNAEKYITEAIDSILNQTFRDFELIIIDDGSSDRTVEIVKSYSDKRIRFYQNEHNSGVAATLNHGLDLATGEYIARMDSDDISLPERFEKQLSYLEMHPDITVLASNVRNFGADLPAWPSSETNDALKVDLLFNSCLCHPTVMMRGSAIYENHIRYDEAYNRMEDYELWERMIQSYQFACLQEELYLYRIHPNQVTQTKSEGLLEQYKQLKFRILQRLGMDVHSEGAQCFVKYCFGAAPLTQQEKDELRAFLLELHEKNRQAKVYDEALLEQSLQSVILSTYADATGRRKFAWEHRDWFGNSARSKFALAKALLRG